MKEKRNPFIDMHLKLLFVGYLNAKKGIVQILNYDYFCEYMITRGH